MSFHVGQLVVCVDDAVFHRHFARPQVRRGRVYTISGLGPADWTGTAGVAVEGVVAKGSGFFRASRFRPVDETRIDIFRKIAASPRQEVDA